MEKHKNFQNLKLPIEINNFFRFSEVDYLEKSLFAEKIHKISQKNDDVDFGQKSTFFK